MAEIRILRPGDEALLEAFLLPRIDSSMFLLGNLRAAGLADSDRPYEGTYAAAFEGGQVVAVAAHYWNGNLVLQAPVHLVAVAQAALATPGRSLLGLIGPGEQVGAAREALGIEPGWIQWDEEENLYTLALDDLIVPEALGSGRVQARRIEPRDVPLVTDWRVAMRIESMHDEDTPQMRQSTREGVERSLAEGRAWLLEQGGRPVSTTGFNAALAEAVQIGGVYTPHELRGRGYARAVVAASLLEARVAGVEAGVLFTGQDNWPAQKAYRGLGFRHVGEYRLLLLRPPASR